MRLYITTPLPPRTTGYTDTLRVDIVHPDGTEGTLTGPDETMFSKTRWRVFCRGETERTVTYVIFAHAVTKIVLERTQDNGLTKTYNFTNTETAEPLGCDDAQEIRFGKEELESSFVKLDSHQLRRKKSGIKPNEIEISWSRRIPHIFTRCTSKTQRSQ